MIVGFPATDILSSRVRFCISSGQTRKDLECALDIIKEVGDLCRMTSS